MHWSSWTQSQCSKATISRCSPFVTTSKFSAQHSLHMLRQRIPQCKSRTPYVALSRTPMRQVIGLSSRYGHIETVCGGTRSRKQRSGYSQARLDWFGTLLPPAPEDPKATKEFFAAITTNRGLYSKLEQLISQLPNRDTERAKSQLQRF